MKMEKSTNKIASSAQMQTTKWIVQSFISHPLTQQQICHFVILFTIIICFFFAVVAVVLSFNCSHSAKCIALKRNNSAPESQFLLCRWSGWKKQIFSRNFRWAWRRNEFDEVHKAQTHALLYHKWLVYIVYRFARKARCVKCVHKIYVWRFRSLIIMQSSCVAVYGSTQTQRGIQLHYVSTQSMSNRRQCVYIFLHKCFVIFTQIFAYLIVKVCVSVLSLQRCCERSCQVSFACLISISLFASARTHTWMRMLSAAPIFGIFRVFRRSAQQFLINYNHWCARRLSRVIYMTLFVSYSKWNCFHYLLFQHFPGFYCSNFFLFVFVRNGTHGINFVDGCKTVEISYGLWDYWALEK